MANGHIPTFSNPRVDPRDGAITISLRPHDLDGRHPDRIVHGRVVDELGSAVAGAVIEPMGMRISKTSSRYGRLPEGIDPLALSDERGEFRLGVDKRGRVLHVRISAPNHVPAFFEDLTAGAAGHECTLEFGVTVTGRVLKDGKPLAGVAVGLVQQDRSVGNFVGAYRISTNKDGEFTFLSVPSNDRFYLYGVMESCRMHGAIPVQELRTGPSGSTKDRGDVVVRRGRRLTGRVVLSDGKPVPAGSRILISCERAWDFQTVSLPADGRFSFDGLPWERYKLIPRINGYHVSPKNRSFDPLRRFGLIGIVDRDTADLQVLMDPGPVHRPQSRFDRKAVEEYRRRKSRPLAGAPAEVKQ